MDVFLIKATQLILALAFLIVIHEFGHFLFARIFGVKVEKFYIFFDPWTELFKWRPNKYIGFLGSHKWLKGATEEERQAYLKDKLERKAHAEWEAEKKQCEKEGKPVPPEPELTVGHIWAEDAPDAAGAPEGQKKKRRFWKDTEYGIGWIPLGGYCKISGMIDESMDTEQMKRPAQKWEFLTKPAWQRLLIMVAGVLFNFLLAILIYAGIVYSTGEKYVRFDRAELGMAYSPAAHEVGFRDGDIPLTADGKTLDYPADAMLDITQASTVQVLRDGRDTVNIAIPSDFPFILQKEMEGGKTPIHLMTYRIPTRVISVMAGEGAAKAGIREGDEIVAVDSIATPSLFEFKQTLEQQASLYKKEHSADRAIVLLTLSREGGKTETVPVELSDNDMMGVGLETDITRFYPAEEKHYSLLASIPRGVEMGVDKLTSYAKSMKLVATKEGAKSIGGFGSIGSIFPEKWDWVAFWNIAAFLSVALAFMNILPIPALDGGHVLFLLYEIIFRRPPSQKFMEVAQMCGMAFLILLLLYANGMDIVRLFIK